MREVVGEAFLDVVVLLQGLKSVLENGVIRHLLQALGEFTESGGALVANARHMGSRVEIKGRFRPALHQVAGHQNPPRGNLRQAELGWMWRTVGLLSARERKIQQRSNLVAR